MNYKNGKYEGINIAYIGGGSRGWAWTLMSDLVKADDISGTVRLYDINKPEAEKNAIIGNKISNLPGSKSKWDFVVSDSLKEALTGADFVVISIMPGNHNDMYYDVHLPEKYGIYQSVGDTTGPGGIIRALRTIPMFEEIAEAIRDFSPNAWVINYTNPMTLCVRALYRVFPEIKAFGCCHEVFGTQKFLANVLKEKLGIEEIEREEIKANVVGVNHFTWLTEAYYKNIDIYPIYKEFCEEYGEKGYGVQSDTNWKNSAFSTAEKVKMDLFNRFGVIAAAGDRHLAEFCEASWYLDSQDRIDEMLFTRTSVEYRKNDEKRANERKARLVSGEEIFEIGPTGEEGVLQMRALLGLEEFVTNVNIPNYGQIPNLPIGAVVEVNARFSDGMLTPVFAGNIPMSIYPLISRIVGEQEMVTKAIAERDLSLAFNAFINDPLVRISVKEAKALFDEMLDKTKKYLGMYNISNLKFII